MYFMFSRVLFFLVAVWFAAVAVAAEGKSIGTESFKIPEWFKNSFLEIEEDAAEAGEENKHLLLFFHLDNCPYCAKMLSDSFSAEGDNEKFIRQHFDSVEINIRGQREVNYQGNSTTEKQFSRNIGVQYTPTLLFIDAGGSAALTVSGYRSPAALRHALNYVKDAAYRRMSLTEYNQHTPANTPYRLRAHPDFSALTDLSNVQGPLMLIWEDATCDECDWVHERVFNQPDVRAELQKITVVRFDARANTQIITPAGAPMSMAEFARQLNISYRPGVIFFEDGKEIFRISGLLNRYHFREATRYVALGHRRLYPRWGAYLSARRKELLISGETIDYSIQ